MKKALTPFVRISRKNIKWVSQQLKKGKGRVLLIKSHYYTYPALKLTDRFEILLFDHPKIDVENECISTYRKSKKIKGKDHQTGWKKDREFRFRKVPQPAAKEQWETARSFFERLVIEDKYELSSGFPSIVGCGVLEKDTVDLYIFPGQNIKPALSFAVNWIVGKINAIEKEENDAPIQIVDRNVKTIMAYLLRDIKTGESLMHNVEAGQAADAFVGLS